MTTRVRDTDPRVARGSGIAVIRYLPEPTLSHDGRLTKQSKQKAGKKKAREIVVVGSKVKDVVRNAGLRSDGELVQAVSDAVHDALEKAIERAKDNKRGTVRPYDL